MSDTVAAATDQTQPVSLPAQPAVVQSDKKPIDLAPFEVKGTPPSVDPAMRQVLFGIGVQAGMLMMRANTTPEEVAKKIGIDIDLMYLVMTGREPDIGVRALAALAKHLGGQFFLQIIPPASTQQPATAG